MLGAMSDRTLVLLKPDAVERGLVGQILGRFEAKNLKVVALDLRTLDADTLARHYEEHVGKPFYADLVAFMTWMSEPQAATRVRLGVWVMLFLAVFTVIAWRLNAAFWKDVK